MLGQDEADHFWLDFALADIEDYAAVTNYSDKEDDDDNTALERFGDDHDILCSGVFTFTWSRDLGSDN